MWWIVAAAWGAAVLIAAVVLGFAGYEVTWKAARLRRDGERLVARGTQLSDVAGQLQRAQQLIADIDQARRGTQGSRLEQRARRVPRLPARGGLIAAPRVD